MIRFVIGRGGVLRTVGADLIVLNERNEWMRGPTGGILMVTRDGGFLVDAGDAEHGIIRAGGVPTTNLLFRLRKLTNDVAIVVDPATGDFFPDTPDTVTNLATGEVVPLTDFIAGTAQMATAQSATGEAPANGDTTGGLGTPAAGGGGALLALAAAAFFFLT